MRKYYLFNIKNEFYNIYYRDPYGLYRTLYNLYKLKHISYEVALFNQVCNLIDTSVIKYYIENTYKYRKNKNKYLIDDYLVELNSSSIIILSNKNIPDIFKSLNIYSKQFIVVDFINNDYFWLNQYLS